MFTRDQRTCVFVDTRSCLISKAKVLEIIQRGKYRIPKRYPLENN